MRNKAIIQKMIGYIDKIMGYCMQMDYDSFVSTPLLMEACVFNLSQLGESVCKLDDVFCEEYPDVPWKEMRGLRNRIVHDYDGVKPILVWEIIETDLPILKTMLSALIC